MRIFKKKETTLLTAEIDAAENAIASREVQGLTQRQIVIRRFLNHRAAVTSLIILATLVLVISVVGVN